MELGVKLNESTNYIVLIVRAVMNGYGILKNHGVSVGNHRRVNPAQICAC